MTRNVAIAEFFYCIIALIFLLVGIKALRDKSHPKRISTTAFWFILAFTFWSAPICLTGSPVYAYWPLQPFAANRVVQSASDVPEAEVTRKHADTLRLQCLHPGVVPCNRRRAGRHLPSLRGE